MAQNSKKFRRKFFYLKKNIAWKKRPFKTFALIALHHPLKKEKLHVRKFILEGSKCPFLKRLFFAGAHHYAVILHKKALRIKSKRK